MWPRCAVAGEDRTPQCSDTAAFCASAALWCPAELPWVFRAHYKCKMLPVLCYRFCNITLDCFCASRNLGEDNFREVFVCWQAAGCFYAVIFCILYKAALAIHSQYIGFRRLQGWLGMTAFCQGALTVCWDSSPGETWSVLIPNPISCRCLHCISETAAQVVHLIIAHYCLHIM